MLPTLVHLDESDVDSLSLFGESGFVVSRREARISIDVDSALRVLSSVRVPQGVLLLSAADADEEALRQLDDELRGDVPGTLGWTSSRADFHESTFGDPGFDPTTYLVAVDRARGELLGLVRIWMNATGPRLGLLGVRRHVRRRRLGSALLAEALAAVRAAGETRVVTEYDEANDASRGLAARLGAVRLGWTIEIVHVPERHGEPGRPTIEEHSRVGA